MTDTLRPTTLQLFTIWSFIESLLTAVPKVGGCIYSLRVNEIS